MSSVKVLTVADEPLWREFEALFREHYALVYRTAFSITGTAEDAEDVVQTIFLRLYRRSSLSALQENPKAYLYRAAVNGAVSVVRSRQRRVLAGSDNRIEDCLEIQAPTSESAVQAQLLDAIAQLNPRAVEMLILRYEHNYSDAEIAKLLGTSRGVIAVSLFRARRRLKKLLRPSSGGQEKP